MDIPPLKIAIVGAGISGLSTYLFLKKHLPSTFPHEIKIFENYPSPSRNDGELSHEDSASREAASFIGGGLGVAPNGMHVLRSLDPEIHRAVVDQGYPTSQFQFKNSRNWTLGSISQADFTMQPPEVMVMSSRQGVWHCLRDKVPDEALQTGKRVTKLCHGVNDKPLLEFSDNSKTDEFDLVIGADGVKSVVKAMITPEEGFDPIYQGVCGIGGFVPSSYLESNSKASQSPVVMTFGAEGFFGYGPCETDLTSGSPHLTAAEIKSNKRLPYGPRTMWWSTFEADEPENLTTSMDVKAVREQLLARHSNWQDPFIRKVLADPHISVMTATYTTPKLETWTNNGIVLIGDAAHCLPSSSGQGVSQALEDAQSLAILLAHYLQEDDEFFASPSSNNKPENLTPTQQRAAKVQAAMIAFQTIRKPRVEKILDISSRMSNQKKKMGLVAEWTTYAFMWVMCAAMSWMDSSMYSSWDVEAETQQVIQDQRSNREG